MACIRNGLRIVCWRPNLLGLVHFTRSGLAAPWSPAREIAGSASLQVLDLQRIQHPTRDMGVSIHALRFIGSLACLAEHHAHNDRIYHPGHLCPSSLIGLVKACKMTWRTVTCIEMPG